jgi:DNA ligase-1
MNTPTPMLARIYEKSLHRVTYPCFSQPKLDGIRCLHNQRGGWSRQGNPFVTIQHISDSLEDTFRQCPQLLLDGELYNHRLHDDFNEIVSLVKKARVTEAEAERARSMVEFWVFDCHVPGWDWTFQERYEFIQSLPIAWAFETPIKICETLTCTTPDMLDVHYERLLLENYEGQMIRINGPYEESGETQHRSWHLLKRKASQTAEFPIIGINEGEGKCRGMAGSVTCETVDHKNFEAACKMSFFDRKRLWNNRAQVLGESATVRFQNFTPDGIPRFGRVVAIRNYE